MKIDWNELITNTGLWVWVIVALGALWVIGSIPVYIRDPFRKQGKPAPALLEDHIVLVEIVWIAILFYLGRFIKL